MKKLTPQQVTALYYHLAQTGLPDELINELLDHMACEVEHHLWRGFSFDAAMTMVLDLADAKAVQTLREAYKGQPVMSDEQLRKASLDDIVFEFRNKAYGAYDLRQSYRQSLRIAFIIAVGICLMIVSMMDLLNSHHWTYFSKGGAMWLLGLSAVTFGGISWYLQHLRQQQLALR